MDDNRLKIKSFEYWDVYLHENQCYGGRVFALLKEEGGIEDFLDIKGEGARRIFLDRSGDREGAENSF